MALSSTQEREMRVVQLFIDAVLDNVLEDRRPSGHLIRLLCDAFLTFNLPDFLAIALKCAESVLTYPTTADF